MSGKLGRQENCKNVKCLGEHDLSKICKSRTAGHAGGIISCVVEYLLEISV